MSVFCSRADTLLAAGEIEPPDLIKIDVEGAEAEVLRGALGALEKHPIVLLATHGDVAHRDCLDLLRASGYEVHALDGGPPAGTDELIGVAASSSGYQA